MAAILPWSEYVFDMAHASRIFTRELQFTTTDLSKIHNRVTEWHTSHNNNRPIIFLVLRNSSWRKKPKTKQNKNNNTERRR